MSNSAISVLPVRTVPSKLSGQPPLDSATPSEGRVRIEENPSPLQAIVKERHGIIGSEVGSKTADDKKLALRLQEEEDRNIAYVVQELEYTRGAGNDRELERLIGDFLDGKAGILDQRLQARLALLTERGREAPKARSKGRQRNIESSPPQHDKILGSLVAKGAPRQAAGATCDILSALSGVSEAWVNRRVQVGNKGGYIVRLNPALPSRPLHNLTKAQCDYVARHYLQANAEAPPTPLRLKQAALLLAAAQERIGLQPKRSQIPEGTGNAFQGWVEEEFSHFREMGGFLRACGAESEHTHVVLGRGFDRERNKSYLSQTIAGALQEGQICQIVLGAGSGAAHIMRVLQSTQTGLLCYDSIGQKLRTISFEEILPNMMSSLEGARCQILSFTLE